MVEIKRHENESILSALRRFTKRVQQSGVLAEVRKRRFQERRQSDYKKRKRALARVKRQEAMDKMRKLGKI
jgi:small subunit ribosomal protein S21